MSEPVVEINRRSTDVVTGYVPETTLHRAFTYYTQNLDGEAPIWNEMIGKLEPGEANQIIGTLFDDGTFVWSNDVPRHGFLAEAIGKDPNREVARIQTMYGPDEFIPTLWVSSDNEDMVNKLEEYLARNINKSSSIDVLAGSREWSGPPRKLNVGTSRI